MQGARAGHELVRPRGPDAQLRVWPDQRDDVLGPARRRRAARLQGDLAGEGPRLVVQGSRQPPECIPFSFYEAVK